MDAVLDLVLDLLTNIVEVFFDVILNVLSLLPMSPFARALEAITGFEYLGYMNYFIPFKSMAIVMDLYIAALLAFYVYKYVMKITDKLSDFSKL